MDPVRTLAAYLLLAIAASGSAQQAPALEVTPAPAIYMPAYTVEPVVTATPEAVVPEAAQTPEPEVTLEANAEPTPTPMPGGITRILYRRVRGEDVAVMQQQLIDLGYLFGKADGVYGTDTYKAVIQFQLAHDLEPDGIVGEQTLTWLFSGEAIARPTPTPTPTPLPTTEPTPSPVSTPSPTPTAVPTAQIPDAWTVKEGALSPIAVKDGQQVIVGGETLEGISVYEDETGALYLPLRAVVQALSYPEYAHENGSAYEFTVMPQGKVIVIGCETDENGRIAQTMVLLDGFFFVPEEEYTLWRWGEEIYISTAMWNEIVGVPAAEIGATVQ